MEECTFSGFTFPSLPRVPRGRRRRAPRRPAPGRAAGASLLGRVPRPRPRPPRRASALTSRRRRGLQPPPASRSGTRLPSSGKALERLLSLPGTPRLPAASRPPHPPSPNSPASRRLRDATRVFRAPGQRSPHTKQPSRRRAALPGFGAGRADAAGGGDAAPPARRPPPARPRGPQGRRGYRLGSVTPSGAGCRRR